MMTQRERLASGYLYTDMDEGMPEERLRGKMLAYEFNHTSPAEPEKRVALIRQMMAASGITSGLNRRCTWPTAVKLVSAITSTQILIWWLSMMAK